MRYLPLTHDDRSLMLSRIGAADIDELFADIPRDKFMRALPNLPKRKPEAEVERILSRMAAKNTPGIVRAFLRWRGRLQASCARERRSPDTALGVPHQLYALPA